MPGTPKVEIYNQAAGHLGVRPVTLPTESTPVAQAFTRSWNMSRRETIGSGKTPCTTVIEALVLMASSYTIPPDWLYAYQYPSKCLRMWKIYPAGTARQSSELRFSGDDSTLSPSPEGEKFRRIFVPSLNVQVILTNCEGAYAEYSYDLEDTTLWDPALVTSMAYRLAADTAVGLTGDDQKALKLAGLAMNAVSESKRVAASENNTDYPRHISPLDARG